MKGEESGAPGAPVPSGRRAPPGPIWLGVWAPCVILVIWCPTVSVSIRYQLWAWSTARLYFFSADVFLTQFIFYLFYSPIPYFLSSPFPDHSLLLLLYYLQYPPWVICLQSFSCLNPPPPRDIISPLVKCCGTHEDLLPFYLVPDNPHSYPPMSAGLSHFNCKI